ncbi:hypothetical protein [Streptomyces sp. BE230]|uniref:hypothetical protein n=1 Tax=Streptomyces sp. BE230 TaxID=3002526 RepID=UPI002ED053E0|nr:hypothetical protein [Streptomyces sp. BE230]
MTGRDVLPGAASAQAHPREAASAPGFGARLTAPLLLGIGTSAASPAGSRPVTGACI